MINTGDIVAFKGEPYTVDRKLGQGGQGSIWRVKDRQGKFFCVKILNEQDYQKRCNKIENVRQLINSGIEKRIDEIAAREQVDFVFPKSMCEANGEVAYLMDCVPGKTLNDMLIDGEIQKMSVTQKLRIIKKIATALTLLHNVGHCYTDINWGNFMYNADSGFIYVIDCENAANSADIESGKLNFLKGTGFFLAPEVAFGKEKVSIYSDRYALATFIFRMLLDNCLQSAYHGEIMYSVSPACLDMEGVKEAVDDGDLDIRCLTYIFDPKDRCNCVDNLMRNSKNPANIAFRKNLDEKLKIWDSLDLRLKQLFEKAFVKPFDRESRPTAHSWAKIIGEILAGKPADGAETAKKHEAKPDAPSPSYIMSAAIPAEAPRAPAENQPYPSFYGGRAPDGKQNYNAFRAPESHAVKYASFYGGVPSGTYIEYLSAEGNVRYYKLNGGKKKISGATLALDAPEAGEFECDNGAVYFTCAGEAEIRDRNDSRIAELKDGDGAKLCDGYKIVYKNGKTLKIHV